MGNNIKHLLDKFFDLILLCLEMIIWIQDKYLKNNSQNNKMEIKKCKDLC